jgi:predicted DNA-binding protein (MmcQ/YjbR family)
MFMNIESLREFCLSLPHATEDVKWGADICFSIGGKMFCVSGFSQPLHVSLKVNDEEFEEVSSRQGIAPAPYLARYKWALISEDAGLTDKQWKHYIAQSYELIKGKLPKKIQKGIL